ncbi:MAG: polyhydroxyalkanoic acid system family protein [Xanthomonadales bacterium]|nr:polyhydroxyalkanoic acid system family protein [Xanthomonadales bacterium]
MSQIDINAAHTLSREEAQAAADSLSQDLARKFDIDYGWDGDVIHFERPGVQGQIAVTDHEIHIQAYLGMMLTLLKAPIEQEIIRYLRDEFGCDC